MPRRNVISFIGVILLGVLIFAYLLRDVNVKFLINDFDNLNWWWIAVATLCVLLYLGLEGVVTKILMNDQTRGFSFKDALRVPLVEQLFNGITPFSTGGQPAQLFIMLQTGVDGGRASSALLMKFIVFQAMIVINFLISLIIGFNYIAEKMSYLSLFVIFGFMIHLFVIVSLLMIMYWHAFTKKLMSIVIKPLKWFMREKRYSKMKQTLAIKIDTFYAESMRIAHHRKLLVKLIIVTFFQLFFYYLIPYFIMLGLGYSKINIVMIVSLHVLILMIISLFPIPGGSGGAEYSFETLFKSYITSSSKLLLAMVIWRLPTYYLGMFLGAIALFLKPNRIKS